jgi:CRP-like cAMP-binding protein
MQEQEHSTYAGAQLSTPLLQRNRLLAALSTSARLRLLPHVELVKLHAGQLLDPARGAAPCVYFPVTAIASLCQEMPDGCSAQVAMIGHEGMVGLSLLAGVPTRSLRSRVQAAGAALALDSSRLLREFERGGSAMRVLLRYGQALMAQMSVAALCNRHHAIEQQLARWLLMAADRLGTREIAVRQEDVAQLLGVRREGVSEAAGRLRAAGLIAGRRGRFTLLDATGLKARACACYELLNAEYDRVLASALPPTATPRESSTEPADAVAA